VSSDWKAIARRAVLGERVDLQTLPDHWIVPRRFSVAGEQEINELSVKLSKSLPGHLMQKLSPLFDGNFGRIITMKDYQELLDPQELVELVQHLSEVKGLPIEVQRKILFYGIGQHNLTEDGSISDTISEDLLNELLDFPEPTNEVIDIIQEFNSPLHRATSETSGTQPNGSSEETISESHATTSPTEETPST
jgi:hypothetical protein